MQFEIMEDWDKVLETFPTKMQDIYFSKKYVHLYEESEKKALCAVCEDGSQKLLFPYLRDTWGRFYDFETAYGYGGPIANVDDEEWIRKAFACMYLGMKNEGYLCGLVRFHTLLRNEKALNVQDLLREYPNVFTENSFELIYDRHTITIDTSGNEDYIWSSQISSKNRNMIRKAEKNGLVYLAEFDFASMEEFMSLYEETMNRLDAESFYYFKKEYFKIIENEFIGNAFLGTVRKNGELVCGAIFMHHGTYGHYHLEGSNRQFSSLGANNYLLWRAACTMHDLGVKQFHLGGGTSSSEEDTLFKFKKAFSKDTKDFYIGKIIYNQDAYDAICNEWEKNNKDSIYGNRLLKYRY
ncbi:lipid II:glycine glycyltransferase FemX [Butyrivibrio sp. AE2032]|uniref:lipid II:glycine glycyltransferase FemX n=1 Tax=Butyrivibrio sp. AE2032 TaxID=1458463 RepID=UPI000554848F|nr:GNAT family N-acetyltransferase [Butyrivibrio sp. AE2032]